VAIYVLKLTLLIISILCKVWFSTFNKTPPWVSHPCIWRTGVNKLYFGQEIRRDVFQDALGGIRSKSLYMHTLPALTYRLALALTTLRCPHKPAWADRPTRSTVRSWWTRVRRACTSFARRPRNRAAGPLARDKWPLQHINYT